MKKIVKSLFLVMVMTVLLLALTGCGENKKIVATKDGDDEIFGKYSESIEITFKNKKADKIVMTRKLEDEEVVENIKEVLEYLNSDSTIKYELNDKTLIITMDADAYSKQEDIKEDELTREKLKESLEKDGYKVK